jgi:uncharacterized protein YbjQ (UPF0145 family)
VTQQLTAGQMPEAAWARLADLSRRASDGTGLSITDLSIDEFLLVNHAGFDPVAMVVGSSIYHTGVAYSSFNQNMELTTLTAAMYNARELAMQRMVAEAAAAGADGIVGAHLDINFLAWAEDMAEFTAIGTAVKSRSGGSWRCDDGTPFTSDLSGQDFWKLLTTGHRPLGMVIGNCVYHVAHMSFRQMWKQSGQNMEMPLFTQAFYEARELAMSRMQAEAEKLGADLVVGTNIRQHGHQWQSHVTEFLSIGTAVRRYADTNNAIQPTVVLSADH